MTPEEYKKETIQMALVSLDEMELAIKSLRKGIAKGTPICCMAALCLGEYFSEKWVLETLEKYGQLNNKSGESK